MEKYKYLRISFLIFPLIILGIGLATIAFGATPVSEVPELGGKNLGTYAQSVFNIAMGIAGGLAGIAFAIGAIQYMASAGNTTAAGEGKSKMLSAVLGLMLTLGSLIFLKSINPQFQSLGIKQPLDFKDFTGIYLQEPGTGINGKPTKTAFSGSVPSLASWENYDSIHYDCVKGVDKNSLPYYFFIEYDQENYTGTAKKQILSCGGSFSFSGYGSFLLVPITPGIYLFSDTGCNDIMNTDPLTSSTNIGKAGSISIVNYTNLYFMVIEHQNINYQGSCTDFYDAPITEPHTPPPCTPLETTAAPPASLTIVRLNDSPGTGIGIRFYQDTENKGGTTVINASDIEASTKSHQSFKISDVTKKIFNFDENFDTETKIKNICKNLGDLGEQNCPGSAKLYGNYVIKLKAQFDTNAVWADAGAYCKIVSSDTPNFYLDNETLFGEGRKLKSMEILQGSN